MSTKRNAFTLVELLVVITIIGILIALLLPAVQSAREAARRTECSNNLHQIGVSIQHYHDVRGVMPPGWTGRQGSLHDVHAGPGWGWASFVLPYMEQTSLAFSIDYDAQITDAVNAFPREFQIPGFTCPTEQIHQADFMLDDEDGNPLVRLAVANYVGNFGTLELEEVEELASGVQARSDGVFFHNSAVPFGEILDGLSHTIFVGERSSLHGFSTWVGAVPEGEETFARILAITDHQPNHPTAHFDDFGSFHPQGANFVLGDASVRLINEHINLDVYRGYSTRYGGELEGF